MQSTHNAMQQFRYEINSAGQTSAGVVQALDLPSAIEQLHARGAVILGLTPAKAEARSSSSSASFIARRSTGLGEVAGFTRQIAVMLRSGMSLRDAVECIAEQPGPEAFGKILDQVLVDLEAGQPLSQSLERFPQTFSPLYVAMVRASEMTGALPRMLDRLAEYLQQNIQTRAMLLGAMMYPAIIGVMAVGVTLFLLTFVLPRFMIFFAGKEAMLPAPTRLLLGISSILRTHGLIIAVIGAAISWLLTTVFRSEKGRLFLDRLKLRAPGVKRVFHAIYLSRALHTMGQLVNAGVPILDTISITSQVSGNRLYRQMWSEAYEGVRQGKRLCLCLQNNPLLPRAVVQMMRAGEESGRLGEVLDDISAHYWRELTRIIKIAASLVEPLMILVMGAIVGFIALSIILPIFKLSHVMAS